MSNMSEEKYRTCQVLVIGSARLRLAKVMALLLPLNETNDSNVAFEYLPCVATFDSYADETGNQVRYLISVNYHGVDGNQKVGSSLAPFFDQEPLPAKEEEVNKRRKNLGILGAAMGVGIGDVEDLERIRVFFQTLRGSERSPLKMEMIQPNPEYSTMKEETEAFKALSPEAKEEAALQHSIGPGKMAKFAHDFATGMIQEILDQEEAAKEAALAKEREQLEQQQKQQKQAALEAMKPPREIDPNKPRYACRKCRTVLFGDDDMEDPPHLPAQHKFSSRKHSTPAHQSTCQSFFLKDSGLDWMGDMSEMEGRFNCPKCKTKVGTWHWAGAQCSCGTWVSPAVQIPQSKVDTLGPVASATALPAGTILVQPFVPQQVVPS